MPQTRLDIFAEADVDDSNLLDRQRVAYANANVATPIWAASHNRDRDKVAMRADGEFRIGVLMIGSLYWDPKQHREDWRRDRLDLSSAQRVRVPIRYGRRSLKRACTFTMVFSAGRTEEEYGVAIVVPCRSRDLLEEAVCFWTAETQCGKNRKRRISAEWGCVGVLENPGNPIPEKERQAWNRQVSGEQCYGHLNSAAGEKAAVDRRGFLQIPWPRPTEGPQIAVDVLLATATNPTIVEGNYAPAEEIAQAWIDADPKEEAYFRNNRKNGITTFEDGEIENHLRARNRL